MVTTVGSTPQEYESDRKAKDCPSPVLSPASGSRRAGDRIAHAITASRPESADQQCGDRDVFPRGGWIDGLDSCATTSAGETRSTSLWSGWLPGASNGLPGWVVALVCGLGEAQLVTSSARITRSPPGSPRRALQEGPLAWLCNATAAPRGAALAPRMSCRSTDRVATGHRRRGLGHAYRPAMMHGQVPC